MGKLPNRGLEIARDPCTGCNNLTKCRTEEKACEAYASYFIGKDPDGLCRNPNRRVYMQLFKERRNNPAPIVTHKPQGGACLKGA